ncbi:MAG: type IV pilin protein [Woeseiaceae bacterium]|nr:type IV pilin protein [Woeseiaceae bacterium]
MNRKDESGITLIEMLVVVAFIAILGALALPQYADYKRRAQRVDARTALQQISVEQERFFTSNHTYTDDLSLLGIVGNLSANGLYELRLPTATASEFQAIAVPAPNSPQVKDLDCQQFSINSLNERSASPDLDGNCW